MITNGRRRSRRIDAAHRQSHRQRSAVRFIAPLNRRAGTDAARNSGHPIPPRGVQGTASRNPRRPRQLYPPADGQPRPQPAATPRLPPAPLRLRKPDRRQVLLRPCSLEELLAPDHPARMGWAITERFDLEKFLTPIRAREGHVGRDATDLQVLVALWLYAAIDGVGSGRDGECRDQGLPRLGAAVGRIGRIFDRCVLAGMTRRNRTHLREGSVRRCCTYGYCSLEELLAPDHPARMGWAITERFDLEKFLTPIRAREGHVGRDATDPQVLVALWLYAAIDGVGSGRDGECRDQGLPRLGAAVGRIGRIFDRCVLAGMTRRNRTHLREGSVRRCRTYGYGYCQGQGPATVCAFACALNGGSAQTRPSVAALGRCRQ